MTHSEGVGGVVQFAREVDMADHGADEVEGAHGAAVGGLFRQVGAHRQRVTGQDRDPAAGAPAFPASPDSGVDVAGRLGAAAAIAAAIRSPSVSVRGMTPTGSTGRTRAVAGSAELIIVVMALS
jgi:hypothetical protein